MKYEQQFKKGALEMVLLSLISQEKTYGYELICRLESRENSIFSGIKEGTVYPILYRLEDDELIKSHLYTCENGGRNKKYYEITLLGEKTLAELKKFWSQYKNCIDMFMED